MQLIEYPEGEDIVDHKGRSKPIYKPSSPRPSQWRPDPIARILLGLFPGLRLMVTKSVPAGLPYALLGLLAGLGTLLVILKWSVHVETIRALHIQPRWILVRATAILALVGVYELLRFGAAVEEQPRPLTPRVLAALPLPAFVVVTGAPSLLFVAPRALEATWFCALVLGFGTLPGAIACLFDNVAAFDAGRFRVRAGIVLAVLVATMVFLPVLGVPLFAGLEGAARAAGFRVLPALIP